MGFFFPLSLSPFPELGRFVYKALAQAGDVDVKRQLVPSPQRGQAGSWLTSRSLYPSSAHGHLFHLF